MLFRDVVELLESRGVLIKSLACNDLRVDRGLLGFCEQSKEKNINIAVMPSSHTCKGHRRILHLTLVFLDVSRDFCSVEDESVNRRGIHDTYIIHSTTQATKYVLAHLGCTGANHSLTRFLVFVHGTFDSNTYFAGTERRLFSVYLSDY